MPVASAPCRVACHGQQAAGPAARVQAPGATAAEQLVCAVAPGASDYAGRSHPPRANLPAVSGARAAPARV